MKKCSSCNIDKDLSEFYSRTPNCKACVSIIAKEWRASNKELASSKEKRKYEKNKEKILERARLYAIKNKEKIRKQRAEYRSKNKDVIRQRKADYGVRNRVAINARRLEKKKANHKFAFSCLVRSITTKAFLKRGYKKDSRSEVLLGAPFEIVKQHIERQFKKGMSWENKADWHIDHKIPLKSANTKEEIERLCHYTNLQPLWKAENLSKGAKIIPTQMVLTI